MAFDRATGYVAGESGLDIYAELATAYVPAGSPRDVFSVLDAHRARLLAAWAATLVPGADAWPSGAEVGAVEYIDQNLAKAAKLRPLVLELADHADRLSTKTYSKEFVELSSSERTEVLTLCEGERPTAFVLVMELVYEAYYRDPTVLKTVQSQTGFRPRLAVDGFAVPTYDEIVMSLLAEVGERPSLVREAGA